MKALVHWISVLTRLPPPETEVLFVSRRGDVRELNLGYYDPGDPEVEIEPRWTVGEWEIDNVTHWAAPPVLPR